MNLVIIFGPQAVGKMTVGHELEKITDLKLLHNHMTIELVQPFFNYGTPEGKRLVRLFRDELLKAIANSEQAGIIFTMIWDFDNQSDWDYIEEISNLFSNKGAQVCLVELEAGAEVRVARNTTEHRLNHKPTKRDIAWSESNLRESLSKHRLNSNVGEMVNKNYLRINNTNLKAEEVAQQIKDRFNL